ncbi:MAG: hypothetical protein J6N19_05650 [Clostridium sp.]|nr:hypothetical protein [Clostridium sp.]
MTGGLREALELVAELATAAEFPKTIEVNGKQYTTQSLREVGKTPKAEELRATTLTSLMDYIRDSRNELHERMIIQVINPKRVELMTGLTEERDRETLFVAKAETPEFRYDAEYGQKEFMIAIQSCFEIGLNDDRALLQSLAGNIDAKQEVNYSDDGVTQICVARTGVATKENVLVPNPVTLTPFRTFYEVEQPESEFVFRIENRGDAPKFKLIEADGGRWKYEAMQQIKEYILKKLQEEPVEGVHFTVIA